MAFIIACLSNEKFFKDENDSILNAAIFLSSYFPYTFSAACSINRFSRASIEVNPPRSRHLRRRIRRTVLQ